MWQMAPPQGIDSTGDTPPFAASVTIVALAFMGTTYASTEYSMSNSIGGNQRATATRKVDHHASPEGQGERRLVSPFRCRIWAQHARPEEQLTEWACKSLSDSIAKSGQHQPVLGRPVTDDPGYDVEIICGARRHAAALSLGRDLLVEVRELNDAQAYVAMYEENAQRKDDCPYVQGQILRRAQLSGACSSQDDLAYAFNLSHSKVSRLLMVAQLPSVVVAAFQSPHDIRERWGVELFQLCKDNDPGHTITARARLLVKRQPRPSARGVYQTLITAPAGDSSQPRHNRSTPVKGSNGILLFREQEQTTNVIFSVPKAILSAARRDAIKQAMVRVLDEQNTDPARGYLGPGNQQGDEVRQVC